MEELIPEGIRTLAQQGTGWLIACFVCAGWYWYARETRKERLENERIRNELQEKRVTEAAATVATLNQATQANVKMADALEEQAQARNALMQLVVQIEREMDRNNEAWKPLVGKIIEILERLDRRPV